MAATPMPVGGTEQSELVTVSVNGATIGIFDTWSGGDAEAPSVQHRPGGLGPQISYSSLAKFTQMVVGRVINLALDWELIRTLIPQSGIVVGAVTIQPLDANGTVYGSSRTATGMFLGVKGIKGDSNSDALQMFELDFSVDSWA